MDEIQTIEQKPRERKLATIRRIKEILPIEGADLIELVRIDGWQCVVAKKDNFKIGDLCIYAEIDSILPECPEFEFLRNKKFIIKTQRMRGALSQGICFTLSILESITNGKIIKENEELFLII